MSIDHKICKIAAIVATFNRKRLLLKCINAIFKQSKKPDAIFIIDGPSTDGTPELLFENKIINEIPPKEVPKERKWKTTKIKSGIKIYYIRLYDDIGGAGGFNEGIKSAYKEGYNWFWLMDDDAEPTKNALYELIKTVIRFRKKYPNKKLGLLCSKVVWKDGSIHKMNVPIPSSKTIFNRGPPFNEFDDIDAIRISGCSFVSALISKNAVKKVGLPIKEFFIWYDDIEYTKRITNNGFVGLYVRKSIVKHNTKYNYNAEVTMLEKNKYIRYYINVRNKLFVYKKESLVKYLLALTYQSIVVSLRILIKRKDGRILFLLSNIRGILASLIFNPKIEYMK